MTVRKAAQQIAAMFSDRPINRPMDVKYCEEKIQQALSEAVRPYEELAKKWRIQGGQLEPEGRRVLLDCAERLEALSQPKGGEKL